MDGVNIGQPKLKELTCKTIMAIKTVVKRRTVDDLERMHKKYRDIRDDVFDADKLVSANDQVLHADSCDDTPGRHLSVFYRLSKRLESSLLTNSLTPGSHGPGTAVLLGNHFGPALEELLGPGIKTEPFVTVTMVPGDVMVFTGSQPHFGRGVRRIHAADSERAIILMVMVPRNHEYNKDDQGPVIRRTRIHRHTSLSVDQYLTYLRKCATKYVTKSRRESADIRDAQLLRDLRMHSQDPMHESPTSDHDDSSTSSAGDTDSSTSSSDSGSNSDDGNQSDVYMDGDISNPVVVASGSDSASDHETTSTRLVKKRTRRTHPRKVKKHTTVCSASTTTWRVQVGGYMLTSSDIWELENPKCWYNDTLIRLILEQFKPERTSPGLVVTSTYFWPKASPARTRDQQLQVQRWFKGKAFPIKMDRCDAVLIPCHLNRHWALCLWFMEGGEVFYLNSLPEGTNRDNIVTGMERVHTIVNGAHISELPAVKFMDMKFPRQQDGYSCGWYVTNAILTFMAQEQKITPQTLKSIDFSNLHEMAIATHQRLLRFVIKNAPPDILNTKKLKDLLQR